MSRLLMDRWLVKPPSWALGVAVLLLVVPVGWVEADVESWLTGQIEASRNDGETQPEGASG